MNPHFGSPLSSQVTPRLLRLDAVRALTGLSRSTLYELMSNHEFPRPLKLSARCVAWVADDVDRWISERIEAAK